jgi:hypothetical protein
MVIVFFSLGVVMWASFLMMESASRDRPLTSREVVAAEDRPAASKAAGTRAASTGDRGHFGSPGTRRAATDRDYWRWYGSTHVGNKPDYP